LVFTSQNEARSELVGNQMIGASVLGDYLILEDYGGPAPRVSSNSCENCCVVGKVALI